MKTLRIFFITLLSCFLLASCDFLEKDPTSLTTDNYFTTEDEATTFLTSVYAIIAQQTFYGNSYMYLVAGDDLGHYGGSGRSPATTGLICNNATTSDSAVTAFWYLLYVGVNRANIFLENIDDVPDMDEDLRAQYKAEARFLRAFYYFNLVECWGDVPFKTTSTESVYGLSIARTDKQEIYDFIVTEMAEAAEEGLLSASELSYIPSRVSKSVAWGMLARVLLFRAGEHYRDDVTANDDETTGYFELASYYAQKVLDEGHSLATDYWNIFIDMCSEEYNTTGNESIWEAEFAGNNSDDTQAEGRIGNIIGIPCSDFSSYSNLTGSADPGYSYGFIYSTPKLYNLYVNNGDIDRLNWSIAPFLYVSGGTSVGISYRNFYGGKMDEVKNQYWDISYSYDGDTEITSTTTNNNYSRACAKYRREYEADKKDRNYTAINFPILRYADVLLMIAEAENEANGGPTTLAYDCINQVRERAGISDLTEGLSQDDFRDAVKDERAMELCFEYLRRFDLIRWGEYISNMNELVSVAQSETNWSNGGTNVYTYFNIPDAYNYFPIPDAEISTNNLMTQNPGW